MKRFEAKFCIGAGDGPYLAPLSDEAFMQLLKFWKKYTALEAEDEEKIF